MKHSIRLYGTILLLMLIIVLVSGACKEEVALPEVTTKHMIKMTTSEILLGGSVIPVDGTKITSKGICWSLNPVPTFDDSKKVDELATFGSFEIKVTEFNLDTIYYFRAFAVNEAGVGYGEIMKFRTYWGTVSDIDGNTYTAVRIGSQIWMREDLKVTKYQNNDPIQQVNDNAQWSALTSGAYCSHSGFLHDADSYGLLYNFYAVNDSRKIAPPGWHIPTNAEWETLFKYLGGAVSAGGRLKEQGYEHWEYPNSGATDEYSFTALPGGERRSNGTYQKYNYYLALWSSTPLPGSSVYAHSFEVSYNNILAVHSSGDFGDGRFVRCIKD